MATLWNLFNVYTSDPPPLRVTSSSLMIESGTVGNVYSAINLQLLYTLQQTCKMFEVSTSSEKMCSGDMLTIYTCMRIYLNSVKDSDTRLMVISEMYDYMHFVSMQIGWSDCFKHYSTRENVLSSCKAFGICVSQSLFLDENSFYHTLKEIVDNKHTMIYYIKERYLSDHSEETDADITEVVDTLCTSITPQTSFLYDVIKDVFGPIGYEHEFRQRCYTGSKERLNDAYFKVDEEILHSLIILAVRYKRIDLLESIIFQPSLTEFERDYSASAIHCIATVCSHAEDSYMLSKFLEILKENESIFTPSVKYYMWCGAISSKNGTNFRLLIAEEIYGVEIR